MSFCICSFGMVGYFKLYLLYHSQVIVPLNQKLRAVTSQWLHLHTDAIRDAWRPDPSLVLTRTDDQWWCCQLTDLVYDGVFEVLQWLLFLSAVPPVQLLTGWCVTAKAPPDISAISALTAVKHGNCSSLTPLLNPVRTRKSLIWPWMALDAGQLPALWALASTRFYVT